MFLKIRKKLKFAGYTYYKFHNGLSFVILKGFLPIPIFYTKKFLPLKAVASTKFFCIIILPNFKNDLSVVSHEIIHIKQIFKTLGCHYILYNFSMKYRYRSELHAYANQCVHLIIHSHIGMNIQLIEELIDWVTEVLCETMNFSELISKDTITVRKDFTKVLLKHFKLHKDEINNSSA